MPLPLLLPPSLSIYRPIRSAHFFGSLLSQIGDLSTTMSLFLKQIGRHLWMNLADACTDLAKDLQIRLTLTLYRYL